MRYEMVMVREHRPGFQGPFELLTNREQAAVKNYQALSATEMMLPEIGPNRYEVGALLGQTMQRRMWPGRVGRNHHGRMMCSSAESKPQNHLGLRRHDAALAARWKRERALKLVGSWTVPPRRESGGMSPQSKVGVSPPADHVDEVADFIIHLVRVGHGLGDGFPQQFPEPPAHFEHFLFDRAFGEPKRRTDFGLAQRGVTAGEIGFQILEPIGLGGFRIFRAQ